MENHKRIPWNLWLSGVKIIRYTLAALGLAVLTILFGMGLMLTAAWLLAAAALRPSIADLHVAIVGVRFFGLSRAVLRYLERLIAHDATFRILAHIRTRLFTGFVDERHQLGMRKHSGDVLTRMISDIDSLESFFLRGLSPLIVSSFTVILIASIVACIDAQLGMLIVLTFLIPGIAGFIYLQTHNKNSADNAADKRAFMHENAVDFIHGLPDILIFDRDESIAQRFLATARAEAAARISTITSRHKLTLFLNLSATIGVITIIAIGIAHPQTIPRLWLAPLTVGILSLMEVALAFAPTGEAFATTQASAQRIADLPQKDQVTDFAAHTTEPATLQVDNLTVTYDGLVAVFSDLSFVLPAGEILLVTGYSGTGKSTLLHAIAGLIHVAAGRIRWGDADFTHSNCTICMQNDHLFAGTVRENLTLGRSLPEEHLANAIKRTLLTDVINSLPQGMDTWLGEQGARLSGGERQRLILARTLLSPAPLILLDEPFRHLDSQTTQEIQRNIFASRTEKKSWILAIHHSTEIFFPNCGIIKLE